MRKIFNFLKIIILVLLLGSNITFAGNWYCGDFHVHARADSGGGTTAEDYHVAEVVDNAKRLGFDFLCFTDHSNRSSEKLCNEDKWNKVKEKYKNASTPELIVFPGVEVSDVVGEKYGKGAHINAISVERFYQGNTPKSSEFEEKKDGPEAVTTEYVINKVAEEGGITTLNHPYVSEKNGDKIFWEKLITDNSHITCIEDRCWIGGGKSNFYHDPKTIAYLYPKWRAGIKIWISGGSDAHYDPKNMEWNPELGKEFNVVYAESKSQEAIISAIKKGRLYIVYNGEDKEDNDSNPEGKDGMPTLELFTISDGDKEAMLGDTLITTKKEVQIKIKIKTKREIYQIRVTKNADINFKEIDPEGNSFETIFTDNLEVGLHWYTVDVRAKGGDLILSNPIFVSVMKPFPEYMGRAVWLWSKEGYSIIEGGSSRAKFFNFCKAPHGNSTKAINTIYLSAYKYIIDANKWAKLKDFIKSVHNNGLKVEYLCGMPEWGSSEGKAKGEARTDKFIEFNKSAEKDESFDGLHFDVEPHILDTWESNYEAIWKKGFIPLISLCKSKIDNHNQETGSNVTFTCDIPYYWDSDDHKAWGSITSTKEVQDILDYLTIMAYQDKADSIISKVQDEINYAKSIQKGVVVGVMCGSPLSPKDGGEATFLEEGNNYMEEELSKVSISFAGNSSFMGIAVHDYGDYLILKESKLVFDEIAISLISPHGGEVISGTHEIKWMATGPNNLKIKIQYSSDRGANWNLIAENESNDGSYSWGTEELVEGTSYLIKVTAMSGEKEVSDQSKTIFTIGHFTEAEEGKDIKKKELELKFEENTFLEKIKVIKRKKEHLAPELKNKIKKANKKFHIFSEHLFKIDLYTQNNEVYEEEFKKFVEVRISYPDSDNNGIIDGTNLKEDRLCMYRLNESSGDWEMIQDKLIAGGETGKNFVDTANNVVIAEVAHFSVLGVGGNFIPEITITNPTNTTQVDSGNLTITWTDEDPDDNAAINFYWDSDKDISNNTVDTEGSKWGQINVTEAGVIIPIFENPDGVPDSYTFDTSKIPAWCPWQRYFYVLAIIDDGLNLPEHDYSGSSLSTIPNRALNKDIIFFSNYSYSDKICTITRADKGDSALSTKKAKIIIPPNALYDDVYLTIDSDPNNNSHTKEILSRANNNLIKYKHLSQNDLLRDKSTHTFKAFDLLKGSYYSIMNSSNNKVMEEDKIAALSSSMVSETKKLLKIILPYNKEIKESLKTKENNLYVFYLNETEGRWEVVKNNRYVDKISMTVSADTNRFGTYTLIEVTTLNSNPDHYPNPLRYDDNKYNNIITFINIPANEEIRIYNRVGELIRTINEDLNNPNNERKWNLKNDKGVIVSSDVYFYVVRGEDKKHYVGKVMIIK